MIDYDFGIPIMRGNFYLYFQSFFVDVFGALAIVGVGMAAARRWFVRPKQLVYNAESSLILIVIFAILVSGFLIEGWRIAATDDPWGAWSPFGNLVAAASRPLMSDDSMQTAHCGHLVDAPGAGVRLHRLGSLHQDGRTSSRRL